MHKFRVTFSTDAREHYKGDGKDTTVSMVIAAWTFSEAETEANAKLAYLIADHTAFVLVSVQRVDNLGEKDE